MSHINDNLGVQSYCFRAFKDNADVAAKVKQIGVDRIEVCGVHANFNDPAAWKDIVKIYQDAGVKIVAIGVQIFTGEDKEKRWFECAAAAGAEQITAHFNVDTFQTAVPKAVKLADEFDINIGIHCHGGYSFGGQPVVIKHLMSLGGPRIGLCLDTAWCMQIGPGPGNPVKWVSEFSGRIWGVHFKDFIFDKNAQWHDVVVGQGNLDLPAFTAALEKDQFHGTSIIEYEADENNPVPALTECVNTMRQTLAATA